MLQKPGSAGPAGGAGGGDGGLSAIFPPPKILKSQPARLILTLLLCNICLSLSADVNQIQIVEGSVAMRERFVSNFGEFNETRVGKESKL